MTRQAYRVLVSCLIATLGVATISIVYTIAEARQARDRWCAAVVAQDDAYRESPPVTPAGQEVARRWSELRQRFDCPARR